MLVLCVLTMLSGAAGWGERPVGRQPDGTVFVPSEQMIVPIGRQIEFAGRPVDLALLPDGRTLAVVDRSHLRLIDTVTGELKQSVAGDGGHSVTGIAVSADGRRLYTSSVKGHVQQWTVDADGELERTATFPVPGGVAAGLCLSADEQTLLIAGNKGNTLVLQPLGGGDPRSIDVGVAPFDVARAAGRVYVSNWGGPRPAAGDLTSPSSGTPTSVDARTVGNRGSLTVIDEATLTIVGSIETGLLPSEIAVSPNGRRVYVANANSDTVSVIDTATDRVTETIALRPVATLPFGSASSALALSPDGSRLYVANGTNNAVAVVELSGAARGGGFWPATTRVLGFLPVGWYPGAVAVSPDGRRLFVANTKGVGSLSAAERHNSHHHQGSVSLVDLPRDAELPALTARVAANNRQAAALASLLPPREGVAPQALPERHGEPSRLKYVVYIIRENRTYDQVLGDIERGNGDPSLTIFGREVTPNAHQLADDFCLLDNFHCSGVLSADGHQWACEAYVSSYLERMFGGFFRSYPYEGNDSLSGSAGGYLWDNALAHGRTFRSYGEMVQGKVEVLTDGYRATFKPIHDDFVADGKLDHYRVTSTSTIAAVQANHCASTMGFPSTVPDIYRAAEFIREWQGAEAAGTAPPNLCILLLPNDHTTGTRPDFPTPRASVADNDLALGRIVEAVSRSKFWPETAIFVCQDDPQAGTDHVDGHRSPAFVISPYTPRDGRVISAAYTQIGMVKSIELILGLPPMNQLDAAAMPMRACFTGPFDPRPWRSVPSNIALDEMNPPAQALSGRALYWAQRSIEEPLDEIDQADEDTLNRILWHAQRGYDTPYPAHMAALGTADEAGADADD